MIICFSCSWKSSNILIGQQRDKRFSKLSQTWTPPAPWCKHIPPASKALHVFCVFIEASRSSLHLHPSSSPTRRRRHEISTKISYLFHRHAQQWIRSRWNGEWKDDDKFTCWFSSAPRFSIVGNVSASGTTYQWNEISHQFFRSRFVSEGRHRRSADDDDVYGLSTEVEWNYGIVDNCDAIMWKLNKGSLDEV